MLRWLKGILWLKTLFLKLSGYHTEAVELYKQVQELKSAPPRYVEISTYQPNDTVFTGEMARIASSKPFHFFMFDRRENLIKKLVAIPADKKDLMLVAIGALRDHEQLVLEMEEAYKNHRAGE